MVEISAQQLETLTRAHALLNKLVDHPEKGLDFQRRLKEVDPSLNFRNLELTDAAVKPIQTELADTRAEMAKLREEREAEKSDRETRRAERELRSNMETAARKFGLTDTGMSKMEQRMKDHGNMDAESAAAWVASQEPKAAPTTGTSFGPADMNLYGSSERSEQFAELHKNPVRWMDNEIRAILAESPLAA